MAQTPTPDARILELESKIKDLQDLGDQVKQLSAYKVSVTEGARNRLKFLQNPRLTAQIPIRFLQIQNRLSHPDDLSALAQDKVTESLSGGYKNAKDFIQQNGLAVAMARITSRLNATALDETSRYLLSSPEIYGSLVFGLLNGIGTTDPAKLEKFVADGSSFIASLQEKLDADNGPRHEFTRGLVKATFEKNRIEYNESNGEVAQLIANIRSNPIPLSAGRVEPAIQAGYDATVQTGGFPTLVETYANAQEVNKQRFTPQIKEAMVRYLIDRGIQIDIANQDQMQKFADGGFDEYFALAYEQAVSSAAGEDDPIEATRSKGATIVPWDFTVDTFDTIEEQGVIKDNILAAGALDYVFELGEHMGIFRLADALTLNWAAGAIDVVDGSSAAKLYRYWKLRDQRSDPSERGMVYKRVLNKGDAEVLERMVVNEAFPPLWGALMEKVTEYVSKVETAKAEIGETLLVSRTGVYQAVRELQANLTEFCTGMAHMQTREMYSQLRDALDLLGDPEIIDHFAGGRRKNLWTAIERLSKSEFGEAPNISAIRTAAVEGNTVFKFVANFQRGAVVEEEFQRFIEAAEAWIIAKGSDSTEPSIVGSDADQNGDFSDFEDDDNF